ncbi:MAG: hypothetical protein OEY20_09315, partial [Gemmatimonadota bacterium]|nr:hypothetical protein [Gemmatimonadota bacterium]
GLSSASGDPNHRRGHGMKGPLDRDSRDTDVPKTAKQSLPHLLLNVPALAGRSEAEVADHLGPPVPGMGVMDPNRTKLTYWGGKVEVVFVDGKAGWIKLYGTGDLPFSKAALCKLGLPVKRPTYVNSQHVISWHNLPHLREVSLYGGGPHGSVSSVLICVQTNPQPASMRSPKPRISFPRLRALGHA